MFREECSPHQENIPAYSLGALDAEEIAAFESHLETCKDCQAEMAEFQQIAAGLLHAIPPRMPKANVRRNLINRISPHQERNRSLPARSIGRFSPGTFTASAIMLILLVLNLFSFQQLRALQKQQNALTEKLSTEQAAIALLAYPNTQVYVVNANVQNLTGSILLDKDTTTAVLFLWNLPELTDDQTYQAWLIDTNGERVSAGLFAPIRGQDYTTAFIQSAVELKMFIRLGVTVEPRGGSEQPTSSPVLVVDL